jgi:hypothetical protein
MISVARQGDGFRKCSTHPTGFISGFLLRLRRELRRRGHSYDFAIFQNCRLADSEKPETLSVVRSYFDARQGMKP